MTKSKSAGKQETQPHKSNPIARASTKDLYEKNIFALSVSKDCRLVSTRDSKHFTDYFAVANRN